MHLSAFIISPSVNLSIYFTSCNLINTLIAAVKHFVLVPLPCLLFPLFTSQATGFTDYHLSADHGCLLAGGFYMYSEVSNSFYVFAGVKLFFFHFFFLSFPFRISNSFLLVFPCSGYARLFPDNYIYTASSPRVPGRCKFCNL